MDLIDLMDVWPIPGPWSLMQAGQGENNLTWFVQTPAGKFVLRSYQTDRTLDRIRYELELLNRLQHRTLPFQIPAPVPTGTGDLYFVSAGLAYTMSAWLTGSQPSAENLNQTSSAGRALAELVAALQQLRWDSSVRPAPFPASGVFAGWAGVHMNLPDILQSLPLEPGLVTEMLSLVETARESVPALYETLPQQLIHRDFDQSNVLMTGSRITAVLDFEFSGHDLRALDLAYALSKWPEGLWNTGREWAVLDAFGRGFCQALPLTPEELTCLPQILRVRAAASLFYRLGRFSRGIESGESLCARIRETASDEAWLRVNADRLRELAGVWVHK
jgi:Ser/Thr protein kinase RdoA (MazF antagonist)